MAGAYATVLDDHEVRATVAAYISENFLYASPDRELGADDRLLDDGIVDSMGAVELVSFLEERFAIAVPDDEITEDNFGSVADIARFVAEKRRSAA
jgi:acyl carrier protein